MKIFHNLIIYFCLLILLSPRISLAYVDHPGFFLEEYFSATLLVDHISPNEETPENDFFIQFAGDLTATPLPGDPSNEDLGLSGTYNMVDDDAENENSGFYIEYTRDNDPNWNNSTANYFTEDIDTANELIHFSQPEPETDGEPVIPGVYNAKIMVEEDWSLNEWQVGEIVTFTIAENGDVTNGTDTENVVSVDLEPEETNGDGSNCPSDKYCVLAPLSSETTEIGPNFKLGDYARLILRIGIGLAALLSVLMIVVGGMRWMISDVVGDKEVGKNMITNAIGGLLLVLGAWALLNTINPDILSLRFLVGGVGGGGSEDVVDPNLSGEVGAP